MKNTKKQINSIDSDFLQIIYNNLAFRTKHTFKSKVYFDIMCEKTGYNTFSVVFGGNASCKYVEVFKMTFRQNDDNNFSILSHITDKIDMGNLEFENATDDQIKHAIKVWMEFEQMITKQMDHVIKNPVEDIDNKGKKAKDDKDVLFIVDF